MRLSSWPRLLWCLFAALAVGPVRLVAGSLGPLSSCPNPIAQFVYAPRYKLMFCWIQKIGCTRFKALMPLTRFYKDLSLPGERYYDTVFRILQDPQWQKAMFYREPLSRFLSGYLDKCQSSVRVYCRLVFGADTTSFDAAVAHLATANPHQLDVHFREQAAHCGGLGYGAMQYFTTVELLEPATSRARVGAMLQKSHALPAYQMQYDRLFPPGGRNPNDSNHTSSHDSHAHDKVELAFSNPRHVAIVVDFFFRDYVTFQIPLPAFAVRALEALQYELSPHALLPEKLAVLINITRSSATSEL